MLSAIKRTFQQLGWLDTVLYYLSEIMLRTSRGRVRIVRYCLVAQPVPKGPFVSRSDPNTEIRIVKHGDPLIFQFPRAPEITAMRFARGDICLAATIKGRFAGFLWLAFGAYDEDEVRCRYELSDRYLSWDYDVHVEPEFRMGRTFLRLWDAANTVLRERGVRWTISRISAFNFNSLKSHARLDTRSLGKASFLVLGKLQISFAASAPPHYSVDAKSAPRLELHPPSDPEGA